MNLETFVQNLSSQEQQALFDILQNKINGEKVTLKLEETRFSNGLYCPRCGCIEPIVKCGQYKGKQRYGCKNCGHIFTATTNTFLSATKKQISVWLQGSSYQAFKQLSGLEQLDPRKIQPDKWAGTPELNFQHLFQRVWSNSLLRYFKQTSHSGVNKKVVGI